MILTFVLQCYGDFRYCGLKTVKNKNFKAVLKVSNYQKAYVRI